MNEPHAVPVPPGYRVGVWEVREPLATGSFGSVYAARRTGGDDTLPREAALKFLPAGTDTPRRLAHLGELVERESELLRRLHRPRLIRMHQTLTVDDPDRPGLDGATVLVLERAEASLSALLAAAPRPAAGPALLAQVCTGLAQLHAAGWVHGDLKPANVLLMADGSARLTDFTMAAELEGAPACTAAFATDYTPPELLGTETGERARRIRQSADVWAFGVLAHVVLTDALPLPGDTSAARRHTTVAYARGVRELRLSPELPEEWREIVRDCLARTHEGRIATEELLRRVEAVAGTGRPPRLPRALRSGRGHRRRRRTVLVGAVAVTVALAALGYGIGVRHGGTDPDGKAQASYGAAELRTDSGIPVRYRRLIVDSAHRCPRPAVTPALIAALLAAESGFDPGLADPGDEEHGIARWTPSALRRWIRSDGVPAQETPRPPLTPEESIPALGRYLCFVDRRLKADLPGDRRVLIAVAYRASYEKVNELAGVPPQYVGYAHRIAGHLEEYTPPAHPSGPSGPSGT